VAVSLVQRLTHAYTNAMQTTMSVSLEANGFDLRATYPALPSILGISSAYGIYTPGNMLMLPVARNPSKWTISLAQNSGIFNGTFELADPNPTGRQTHA